MNFLNLNALHNYINAAIGLLTYLLINSGCVVVQATGVFDCTQSWINAQFVSWIIFVLAVLKILMNIFRDGLLGLFKVQPPVVDKPVLK